MGCFFSGEKESQVKETENVALRYLSILAQRGDGRLKFHLKTNNAVKSVETRSNMADMEELNGGRSPWQPVPATATSRLRLATKEKEKVKASSK